MSDYTQPVAVSDPSSQGLAYPAATDMWVHTGGEYAYNTQSFRATPPPEAIPDIDANPGWAPGELDYISQESLANQLALQNNARSISDISMRDRWDLSTDAASTMHTTTMRVASRRNDAGEMYADRSTVRGFLGDHDSDSYMDLDEDEDEDDASSALTSLPSRYNTPKRTTTNPSFDDTTSINSQDERESETAIEDLILACAEQEVEDDDIEESDDGAFYVANETSGRVSPSPFPSPRRSGRRGKTVSRRKGLRSSPNWQAGSSTDIE